ncbi:hypothetical protein WAG19_29810 [Bacillus cereus]|uniref:hypothetical protein n=1 Tax=Bacillus cereus TaxID=1396 RepID=UPI003012C10E
MKCMNANGRNDRRNHNQQMSHGYMNPNHDNSCYCGCQQNKHGYEQQQNNSEQNSQYISNNYGSGNYNGSYSYQGNQYEQQQNQDTYMQNYMYGNHTNYSVLDDLPNESKVFQRIKNASNTTSPSRVIDTFNLPVGTQLPAVGGCSRTIEIPNTVMNELITTSYNPDPQSQYLIFYQMDDGRFVIANRGNSRVLEMITAPSNPDGRLMVSRNFNADSKTQFFEKVKLIDDKFRLVTNENGVDWYINNCHSRPNDWQVMTAIPRIDNVDFMNYDTEDITFPDLSVVAQPLPNPRELTSLNDEGDNPRVIQGKSLIPSIIVNDISLPVDRQVQQSPYYVLEYAQTWFKTANGILEPFEYGQWTEFSGITLHDQLDMQYISDMTIGGTRLGWGLKFGKKPELFRRTILSGLPITQSFAEDMGFSSLPGAFQNTNSFRIRFIKYIKAYEFVLRRLDKLDDSIARWTIYDNTDYVIRKYPVDAK